MSYKDKLSANIVSALKDMAGHPVPKANGGYWDRMSEMNDMLRGLRNQMLDTIRRVESALNGAGI